MMEAIARGNFITAQNPHSQPRGNKQHISHISENVTYNNIESALYSARTDANPQPETPSTPKPQTENANSQPKKNFSDSD